MDTCNYKCFLTVADNFPPNLLILNGGETCFFVFLLTAHAGFAKVFLLKTRGLDYLLGNRPIACLECRPQGRFAEEVIRPPQFSSDFKLSSEVNDNCESALDTVTTARRS